MLLSVVFLVSSSKGMHSVQVILKLWVVYGQNIIGLLICEIEPSCQLFPACLEQFCFILVKKKMCRLEEGHNWFPLEYRLSAGISFLQKPRKCCLPETRASWWCHLQCTSLWSQSVPSLIMRIRCPIMPTSIQLTELSFFLHSCQSNRVKHLLIILNVDKVSTQN